MWRLTDEETAFGDLGPVGSVADMDPEVPRALCSASYPSVEPAVEAHTVPVGLQGQVRTVHTEAVVLLAAVVDMAGLEGSDSLAVAQCKNSRPRRNYCVRVMGWRDKDR